MPHHKSAEKRVRQTDKRRVHNRYFKVMMRNALKDFRTATTQEDRLEKMRLATRILDRIACKGIIHKNFAARQKSHMAKAVAAHAS